MCFIHQRGLQCFLYTGRLEAEMFLNLRSHTHRDWLDTDNWEQLAVSKYPSLPCLISAGTHPLQQDLRLGSHFFRVLICCEDHPDTEVCQEQG